MEFRSGAHSSPRPDLLPESDGLERASVKEKRLEAPLQICRAAVDRVLAENEVRRDDDARDEPRQGRGLVRDEPRRDPLSRL